MISARATHIAWNLPPLMCTVFFSKCKPSSPLIYETKHFQEDLICKIDRNILIVSVQYWVTVWAELEPSTALSPLKKGTWGGRPTRFYSVPIWRGNKVSLPLSCSKDSREPNEVLLLEGSDCLGKAEVLTGLGSVCRQVRSRERKTEDAGAAHKLSKAHRML